MKTVIIDDEKQIREGIKILLTQINNIEIIGEASNITDGKIIIEDLKPDLVLLDIQLNNSTGFDMLDTLEHFNFKLIFITAYNQFAIKAFKYNAFDYLLKPIDPEELYNTLERVKAEQTDNKNYLRNTLKNKSLENLIIKTSEQIHVVPLNDIIRCEADQGYTHFYIKGSKHILSSKTLKEYNSILDENKFYRVHQSHLVNWDYVISFDRKGLLLLEEEHTTPVSVRNRSYVKELLNLKS